MSEYEQIVVDAGIAEAGLKDRATVIDGDPRTYELPTTDLAVLVLWVSFFAGERRVHDCEVTPDRFVAYCASDEATQHPVCV